MIQSTQIVLRYGRKEPDQILDAVAGVDGQVRHVSAQLLRLATYPETGARASECLRRARRVPGTTLHRFLKTRIYAGQYNAYRARFAATPGSIGIVWNGLTGTRLAFAAAARDEGRGCLYVERAPLPGRITVDPLGVNAASSLPRDPAFFLDWAREHPPTTSTGWRRLGVQLVARSSRRSGIGQDRAGAALASRPYLFCPLQVADDTQVTRFAGWCGGMDGFLSALADATANLPAGWHLRLKEHPSSKRSLAVPLAAMQARHGDRIVVDNTTDTFEQVSAARAVVTLNSSVGLQAFFHDRPVIVLGEALFRIAGVVCVADTLSQLSTLFAQAPELGYDEILRDAFMRYLDEVYYVAVSVGSDGRPFIDPVALAPKYAIARAVGETSGRG